MKQLSILALTSALTFFSSAAHAEWYAGVGGGIDIPRDQDIKTNGIKQDVEFDNGWGALGAVGYKYGNGLRSELELGYRDAGVDSVSASAIDTGDAKVISLMANTLYDLPVDAKFVPYIGAGIGGARISHNDVRTIGGSTLDDSDIAFAAQGIAGVSAAIADNMQFFAQYQYQHLFDVNENTALGAKSSTDAGNSLILAGLRYHFNAPQPTPEVVTPAPAPVVEKLPEIKAPAIEKYMVFFDFDRTDITIEAADILKKVADNAQKGNVTRLELTGHADRAGTDTYNDKLSIRRAEAVKKQLMRLGMPASEISTAAKGEHSPLVATGDGVREPQNRRVEIVYGN